MNAARRSAFNGYYHGVANGLNGQPVIRRCEYSKKPEPKKESNKEETKERKLKEKQRIAKLKREYKADLSKAKRAKYSSASLSAHQVLKDLKNSASRSISSVKTSVENLLSQKLRIISPKDGNKNSLYSNGCGNYNELENEPRSPVKLYSPFTIETPSPAKSETYRVFRRHRKIKPSYSMNSQMFASPTGKIKDDIRSVTNSLNELTMISHDIRYKYSVTTSCSNFSITTQ